jgi:hypothetical protein
MCAGLGLVLLTTVLYQDSKRFLHEAKLGSSRERQVVLALPAPIHGVYR